MNDLVNRYRNAFPDDNRTDPEIVLEIGERLQSEGYDLSKYKEFHDDYRRIQRSGRPGLIEEASRGLSRGVQNLQGSLFGLVGLAGDALESTQVPLIRTIGSRARQVGREGFLRNAQQAAETPASVPSFRDVAGPSDLAHYLTGLAGEALPSLGESLAAGAAGALIGSSVPGAGTAAGGVGGFLGKSAVKSFIRRRLARELGEEVADEATELTLRKLATARSRKELLDFASKAPGVDLRDQVGRALRQRGAARFAQIGAIGDSIAQNTGATYNDLVDEGAGQRERIINSLTGGSLAGALDAIVPSRVLSRLFPNTPKPRVLKQADELLDIDGKGSSKGSWKRRFLATLAESSSIEGVTEAAQEVLQELAVANGVPDYTISQKDLVDRMVNAGIAGALAGGLVGGGLGGIEASRASRAQEGGVETELEEPPVEETEEPPATEETERVPPVEEPVAPTEGAVVSPEEVPDDSAVAGLRAIGYSDEDIRAMSREERVRQLNMDRRALAGVNEFQSLRREADQYLANIERTIEEDRTATDAFRREIDTRRREVLQATGPLTRRIRSYFENLEQSGDQPAQAEALVDEIKAPPEPDLPLSQFPVQEIPLDRITLSEDVRNFKEDADPETGVVEGSELQAEEYFRLGTPPIVLWERLDGRLEVITGRHRLDLARRTGEETIPSQIVREADGFDRRQALTFDAESNIRDGQGTIRDYAHYFRQSEITLEEAQRRGLVDRVKGLRGWAIGRGAGDDLYTLYRNKKISEKKAAAIGRAAPLDDAVQRAAIDRHRSMTAEELEVFAGNLHRFRQESGPIGEDQEQGDLFGVDDSAIQEAEAIAKVAGERIKRNSERILAVRGAAKRPEAAKEMGVDVRDPNAIRREIERLTEENRRLKNPGGELLQELREEADLETGPPEITPEPAEPASEIQALEQAVAEEETVTEETEPESESEAQTFDEIEAAINQGLPVYANNLSELGRFLGVLFKGKPYNKSTISHWLREYNNSPVRVMRPRQDGSNEFDPVDKTFNLERTDEGYDYKEWTGLLTWFSNDHFVRKKNKWEFRKGRRVRKASQGQASVDLTSAASLESVENLAELAEDPVLPDEEPVSDFSEVEDSDTPFDYLRVNDLAELAEIMADEYSRDLSRDEKTLAFLNYAWEGGEGGTPHPVFRDAIVRIARHFADQPNALELTRDYLINSLIGSYEGSRSAQAFSENLVARRLPEVAGEPEASEDRTDRTLAAPSRIIAAAQLPRNVRSALPEVEGRLDLNTGRNNQDNEVLPNSREAIDYILETSFNPVMDKPEWMFRKLEQNGVYLTRQAHRVMSDLFDRLYEANPSRFDTMELEVSAAPGLELEEAPGGYDRVSNTLYINPSHPLIRQGLTSAVVTHEMGHFFTSFVLGEIEGMAQWRRFSPDQRARALHRYLQDGGKVEHEGEILDENVSLERLRRFNLNDNVAAMHEWMAYEFSRVVKEGQEGLPGIQRTFKKEGLGNGIIDWIVRFYQEVRDALARLLGIQNKPNKSIDTAIRQLMGFEEKTRVYQTPNEILSPETIRLLGAPSRQIAQAQRPLFGDVEEIAKARGASAWTYNQYKDTVYRRMWERLRDFTGGMSEREFAEIFDDAVSPEEGMRYIEQTLERRGFSVQKIPFEDLPAGENKDRVIRDLAADFTHQTNEFARRRDRAHETLDKAEIERDAAEEKLNKLLQTVNAGDLQAQAKEDLRKLAQQAKQGARLRSAVGRSHQRLGRLHQIIRDLEDGKADAKTVRPYISAIDKLIKDSGLKLFDLLDAIAQLDEDILDLTIPQLRRRFADSSNPDLRQLAGNKQRFAAVTVLARDRLRRDILRARRAPELREQIRKIEQDIKDAEESGVSPKRRQSAITQLTNLGRIKERITQARKELRLIKKRIDNNKQRIELYGAAVPILERETGELAVQIDGSQRQFLHEGKLLLNPLNENSTIQEMTDNAIRFSWLEAKKMKLEEFRALNQRLYNWLQNPENKKNHLYYNTVKKQREAMLQQPAEQAYYEAKSFSRQIWQGPLKHQAQLLGTPQGEEIARQMNTFQSVLLRGMRRFSAMGKKVQGLREDLLKELGLGGTGRALQEFTTLYASPAKRYLEQPGATVAGAVNDRVKRGLIKTKKQSDLFKKYLDASWENDRYAAELQKQTGLGVTDDSIEIYNWETGKRSSIDRAHINVGARTFIYNPIMPVLKTAVADAAPLFEGDVRAITAEQLRSPAMVHFLEPLIRNELSPLFTYANDGEFVPGPILNQIWDDSGRDPAKFFAELHKAETTPQNLPDYIYEQLQSVRGVYNVAKAVVSRAERAANSLGTKEAPSHIAMDARQASILPPEWMGYREASDANNRLLLTSIGFHTAFGKDGEKIKGAIASIREFYDDIEKTKTRLENQARDNGLTGEAIDEFVRSQSRKDERARLQTEARRRGLTDAAASKFVEDNYRDPYEQINRLGHNRDRLDKLEQEFAAVWSHELGPNKEMGVLNELLSLVVNGILQGPKSAFLQTNQLIFPFLRLGVSREAFRQVWSQGRAFFESFGGSMYQALSRDLGKASDHALLLREILGPDAVIPTAWRDELGYYGAGDELRRGPHEGGFFDRARRGAHILGRIWDRGFSKASADESVYRAFRPLAPFSQFVGPLADGSMVSYAKSMERLVLKAAQYFKNHPEALDDPNFKFTDNNKALNEMGYRNAGGLRDRDAFDRLRQMLTSEVGLDLETHARELLLENRKRVFTDAQYAQIFNLGMDHLAAEGNYLTTRAPWLKKGPTQFFSHLLGWSANAPHAFVRMFKGPKGEANLQTFLAGAYNLALIVGPATLGFSILMDWWDEYLIGKKNNHRPLFAGDFPKAAVERFTRMGIAGMPFELVNLGVNIGGGAADLRTFSLDNRVVLVNAIRNIATTIGTLAHQKGTITWSTIGRPMAQQFGAGILQQIDVLNNFGLGPTGIPIVGDLFESEKRYIARLNARNYIRSSAKILDLEVMDFSGAFSAPTPMTPHVTNMILAAYANDTNDFWKAYRKAVKAAEGMGKESPEDSVKRSFSARHPLKTLFRSSPTVDEFNHMLRILNDRGRRDTTEAIRQFNDYGKLIGANPYLGKNPQARKPSPAARFSPFLPRTTPGLAPF